MGYQDELESGSKGIKAGWSISDQVEHYRKKLLRKALEDAPPPPPAAIKVFDILFVKMSHDWPFIASMKWLVICFNKKTNKTKIDIRKWKLHLLSLF